MRRMRVGSSWATIARTKPLYVSPGRDGGPEPPHSLQPDQSTMEGWCASGAFGRRDRSTFDQIRHRFGRYRLVFGPRPTNFGRSRLHPNRSQMVGLGPKLVEFGTNWIGPIGPIGPKLVRLGLWRVVGNMRSAKIPPKAAPQSWDLDEDRCRRHHLMSWSRVSRHRMGRVGPGRLGTSNFGSGDGGTPCGVRAHVSDPPEVSNTGGAPHQTSPMEL